MKTVLFALVMLSSTALSDPSQTFQETDSKCETIRIFSSVDSVSELSVLLAQNGCCKICKKGKACGDSCISRDKDCHVGPGCACDAE